MFMGKYLITGRQGSGKTTLIKMLQKRGFAAYNTDDLPEATKLQDIKSGEAIDWPDGKVDWSNYSWNWQRKEIENLLHSADVVFIGAVVSNQKDFYDLFDRIFVITLSSDSLRLRLESHEHASHHLPGVIERILTNHQAKQRSFINEGATPINGERPPSDIVDELLEQLSLH
ncbi:MAG: hypothetical protein JWO35_776 [Candidatus Saccharibacteria bacterium]|nr:hypothetical protein [Candidatus Saccharibacteria bacterium]